MKSLAIVPARAGSKGIPGKNSRLLGGRPLLAHATSLALESGLFERVLVSTDSMEMAALAKAHGAEAPFLRPPELARDDTPMLPVLQHAVRHLIEGGWRPDIIVLLQPTAPFRRAEDLAAIIALLKGDAAADSVVTVEEVPSHYLPHCVMKIEDGRLNHFLAEGARITRRQDAPRAYTRNGQFYATRTDTLLEKNSIYGDRCVPFITRHRAVNLDTLDDWREAELLFAERTAALPSTSGPIHG